MLKLLYQDEFICVVNKPSGYIVHKTKGGGRFPIVLQTLRDQLGQTVYPVHRLDRGTSGAIAFALSAKTAQSLQASLQSEQTQKKYTALCLGHPPAAGTYNRELSNEKKIKQKAITHYKLLKKFSLYSLVELELVTGRTHQIRRHMSYERHHLIGDVNHGKGWLNRRFRENYNFHRLFLHCHLLRFRHPISDKQLVCRAPLPKELTEVLEKLDIHL